MWHSRLWEAAGQVSWHQQLQGRKALALFFSHFTRLCWTEEKAKHSPSSSNISCTFPFLRCTFPFLRCLLQCDIPQMMCSTTSRVRSRYATCYIRCMLHALAGAHREILVHDKWCQRKSQKAAKWKDWEKPDAWGSITLVSFVLCQQSCLKEQFVFAVCPRLCCVLEMRCTKSHSVLTMWWKKVWKYIPSHFLQAKFVTFILISWPVKEKHFKTANSFLQAVF